MPGTGRKKTEKKYYDGYYYDIFGKRHHISAVTKEGLKEKLKEKECEKTMQLTGNKDPFSKHLKDYLFEVHFVNKKATTKTRYLATYNTHIVNSEIAQIPMNKLTLEMGGYQFKNRHAFDQQELFICERCGHW